MEPSWCQELDYAGMQPHAQERLEHDINFDRSKAKAMRTPGVMSEERAFDSAVQSHKGNDPKMEDFCGIHFGGKP